MQEHTRIYCPPKRRDESNGFFMLGIVIVGICAALMVLGVVMFIYRITGM